MKKILLISLLSILVIIVNAQKLSTLPTASNINGIDYIPIVQGGGTKKVSNDILLGNYYVNVKSYGAVGNGVTDDAQEFRDAIAVCASSGKALYVPKGNYLIASTINITSDISIYGDGLVSKFINTSTSPTFKIRTNNSTSKVRIENISFSGNRTGGGNGAIYISKSDGFTLRDIHLDSLSFGIRVDSVGRASTVPSNITNITGRRNVCAVKLLYDAEYINLSNVSMFNSDTAIFNNAANNMITNSILTGNAYGIVVQIGTNAMKSIVSNCEINHSTVYGMAIESCSEGFKLIGVNFDGQTNAMRIRASSDLILSFCKINGKIYYSRSNVTLHSCIYAYDADFIDENGVGNASPSQITKVQCMRLEDKGAVYPFMFSKNRVVDISDSSYLRTPSGYINVQKNELQINGKIIGNSLYAKNIILMQDSATITNLLANPDCEGVNAQWLPYEGSINTVNNALFNASALNFKSRTTYGQFYQNITGITSGHIFYAAAWVYPGNCDSMSIRLAATNYLGADLGTATYDNLTHGAWTLCSTRGTSTTTSLGYVIYTKRVGGGGTIGADLNYDGMILLDLTAIYGSGSEPSNATMDTMLKLWEVDYSNIVRRKYTNHVLNGIIQ